MQVDSRRGTECKPISPQEKSAIALAIWSFMSKLKQPVEFDVAQALAMGQAAYVEAAKQTIGRIRNRARKQSRRQQQRNGSDLRRLVATSFPHLTRYDPYTHHLQVELGV